VPYCPKCGTEVADGVRFCGNCGADAKGQPNVGAPPAKSEQVIFDQSGVFVSNSRYVTSGQTYAMAGVTSVKTYVEQPSRVGPVITMIIGALVAFGGIDTLFRGNPIVFVVGAGIFALGLWIFRKRVPIYSVVLHSASGEQKSSPSTNGEFIGKVVAALNQAIVARG
jgi:hypothetical protein